MLDKSVGSPTGAADLPDSFSFTRLSCKLWEPGRRQARRNAAALIMEMDGGGGTEVRGESGSGLRGSSGGSTGEFGVVRVAGVGSRSGAASPEGVDGAGPL